MPLYFFHVENGNGFLADEEGSELDDIEAAGMRALVAGAEIVAEELKRGCCEIRVTILVVDQAGDAVLQLPIVASADFEFPGSESARTIQ